MQPKALNPNVAAIDPAGIARLRGSSIRFAVGLVLGAFLCANVTAATLLADSPVFAVQQAPSNLALVLSVEFPTVNSVAYADRTYRASGPDYLGYFDPSKCYAYQSNANDTTMAPAITAGAAEARISYFAPSGLATNHICSGLWSGHFLNWATMQTIDPFRWVLTGGYRVLDTPSTTVVEKAWNTDQSGNGSQSGASFPNGTLQAADIAGATPFGALVSAGATSLQFRIAAKANQMRFYVGAPVTNYSVTYFNLNPLSATCTYSNFSTCTPVAPDPRSVADFSAIRDNVPAGSGSPGTGVNATDFGARYSRSVIVPQSGDYNFRVLADDGARLYLNGSATPLISTLNYYTTASGGPVKLTAGDTLSIKLEYYEAGGGANLKFEWQLPDGTWLPFGSPGGDLYTSTPLDYKGAQISPNFNYDVFVRAKVCDNSSGSGGLEANCVQYSQAFKPQGLIHSYSDKLRFSAFGYLNYDNRLRDGGVLRARQKFVGPTQPVPGGLPITNAVGAIPNQTTAAEWDAGTGVYVQNPDAADANALNSLFGTSINHSGVMNYLNLFGELNPGHDKTYDPVSELYYAAVRYFKNQGNVPEWSDMTGSSASAVTQLSDGFPVITSWGDPIQYYCQKNFILGIGDVNTHDDKNVPGNTNHNDEPALPISVTNDTTVNAITATNLVGSLEGMGTNLGTLNSINGTNFFGNAVGDNNSAAIAGLAYDSHVKDIRPNDFKPATGLKPASDISTIDTFWVDVQENIKYYYNNQFYLAAKYGGFKVPDGYAYGNALGTSSTDVSSWHTNTDTLKDNGDNLGNNGKINLRPDNYYSGGSPDLMKSGLTSAFAAIVSKQKPVSTAFSTALSQVGSSGNSTFSSKYETASWTGEVTASELGFDANNAPITTSRWTLAALLKTQFTTNAGWDVNRRLVTWNTSSSTAVPFRSSSISSSQSTALNSTYVSANDSASLLNYLRGDQSNEKGASAGTQAYRARPQLLGDIVDSKVRVVGSPAFPYLDATNPGYSAFKSAYASRPTVVYFGANDGMLHAINGNLASATTTPSGRGGEELFAYVPGALFNGPNNTPSVDGLASLGNPAFSHHFMVDATPAQYDVDFTRVPGVAPTAAGDWRSLLIGGLGKGGRSYYAIDVTDPASLINATGTPAASSAADSAIETGIATRILWEFSASSTVALGYSFGDPIVAKTKKYGWVVVLTSGYNSSDGVGRVFLVHPKTGALLETLSTGVGSTSNDAGLAQINSFINDSTDGTVDSLYAGDLLGNIWRFDLTALSGAYPAPTKIAVLTDANGAAQPITTAPSLSVDPVSRKRFVLVGTGRLLDSTDISSTQQQTFYAIVDGTDARFNAAADLPKGPPQLTFPIDRSMLYSNVSSLDTVTFDAAKQVGWYEDLGDASGSGANTGWRVTQNTRTLAGTVLFNSTRPDLSNVCSPAGTSRLYGRELASTQSTLLTPVVTGTTSIGISYYNYPDVITDQQYFSVGGTTRVLVGTAKGIDNPNVKPLPGQSLRRLNWRELRNVD